MDYRAQASLVLSSNLPGHAAVLRIGECREVFRWHNLRICLYCLALTSPVLGTEPPLIDESLAPITPPWFLAFRVWSISSYVRVTIPPHWFQWKHTIANG